MSCRVNDVTPLDILCLSSSLQARLGWIDSFYSYRNRACAVDPVFLLLTELISMVTLAGVTDEDDEAEADAEDEADADVDDDGGEDFGLDRVRVGADFDAAVLLA